MRAQRHARPDPSQHLPATRSARALDLNRPLWEIYVVEGLDSVADLPVGSFALLTKVHHAAVHVDSRAEIVEVLHDTTRRPPKSAPPQPWFAQEPPSAFALSCMGAVNSMHSPWRLVSPLARLAPAALAFASDLLRSAAQPTATRFNAVVSPHRVFDTRRFPVAEFERVRSLVSGATLSDAVFAVCGGGLRRYLEAHGELPNQDLAALASISIPPDAAGDAASPKVTWLRVQLATHLADPVQRLMAIQRQSASPEPLAHAAVANDLADVNAHAPAAALAAMSRLFGKTAPGAQLASCTISNVPGPAVPLFLSGARLTYFSAILPIFDGMGLVFAVTNYDGRIVVSPTSCRELMPDPDAFTQCLRDSFQEYLALALGARAGKRRGQPRATPAALDASASGTHSPRRRRVGTGAIALAAATAARPRSKAPRR